MQPQPESPNAQMIGALIDMQAIAEATGTYYAKLVERKIPEDVAARMAERFHDVLMTAATTGLAQKAAASQHPAGRLRR